MATTGSRCFLTKRHTESWQPLSARGRSCCVTRHGLRPRHSFLYFSLLYFLCRCARCMFIVYFEVLLCSRLTALQGQSLRRGSRSSDCKKEEFNRGQEKREAGKKRRGKTNISCKQKTDLPRALHPPPIPDAEHGLSVSSMLCRPVFEASFCPSHCCYMYLHAVNNAPTWREHSHCLHQLVV